MVYLKTKLKTLDRGPTIRIANHALRWCRDNLGINKRKKYQPYWSITKGVDANLVGEYDSDENAVFIYYRGIEDVKELVQTCIHEWTHQNQPIATKYFKYPGTYSRNPYERAALYAEKKHYRALWDDIKQNINKKNGVRNKKVKAR